MLSRCCRVLEIQVNLRVSLLVHAIITMPFLCRCEKRKEMLEALYMYVVFADQ